MHDITRDCSLACLKKTLSIGAYNALSHYIARAGYSPTVGDVVDLWMKGEIEDIPNIGRSRLSDIEQALTEAVLLRDHEHITDAREHPATAPDLGNLNFLTVTEVTTFMRVSKMTVYRLIHDGELEAARFGKSFRVPEQAARQYLTDSCAGNNPWSKYD